MSSSPSSATLICEGVFHLRFIAIGAGEEIVAHSDCHGAIFADYRAVVFPANRRVRSDGKAAIFGAFGTDEVAECFFGSFAELIFSGQSRLEQDRLPVTIGIVRVRCALARERCNHLRR